MLNLFIALDRGVQKGQDVHCNIEHFEAVTAAVGFDERAFVWVPEFQRSIRAARDQVILIALNTNEELCARKTNVFFFFEKKLGSERVRGNATTMYKDDVQITKTNNKQQRQKHQYHH